MKIDMNDISDTLQYPPPYPGEVLLHEYMEPRGMSRNALSLSMRVPLSRIRKIINGERSITADTAIRLSFVFPETTAMFWLSIQNTCDLLSLESEIEKIKNEVVPCRN